MIRAIIDDRIRRVWVILFGMREGPKRDERTHRRQFCIAHSSWVVVAGRQRLQV